jgi:hypothetical protein
MILNKKTVANLEITNLKEVKGEGAPYTYARTSRGIPDCWCDSVHWCTCPLGCPV